jgi:lysophospholipase L1-like esterase
VTKTSSGRASSPELQSELNFMTVLAPLAKRFALAAIAAALVLFSSAARGQAPQLANNSKADKIERPLNLLVLGDSISWGQGLKDEHKAWHLIKSWLEQATGREVRETVEAHSGALIGSADDPNGESSRQLDGELSRAYPTVNGQINNALKAFGDPSQVDLVLVDGCINDLDSRRLLNAANPPDRIRELAQAKCGPPMEALLERITNVFPNANVVVTGYYPILSEKTANDLFMRALAKRFYAPEAGAPKMNDKAVLARLIAISHEWYQTSDQMLAAAAQKIDSQLAAKGSHQRVLFADVAFAPENSFAARQSRLWGFDASWLRKMLVVLTLGRVQLRPNDERRNQRSKICEEIFKEAETETPNDEAVRKDRLTRCRLAAVGHPNRKGAAMYADAVGRLLRKMMNDGWLKDAIKVATPVNP